MPTEHSFWEFGTVLVTVCVPFFLLIGSLNTTKGYEFWKARCKEVMKSCLWFLAFMSGLTPKSTRPKKGQLREGEEEKSHRSYSRRPSCSSDVRHRPQRSPTSTNMEKDDSTNSSEDGGKGKKRWYDPSFLKRISRRNEKDESQTQTQEV